MSQVGELLKAEREKKGLSLHEVGMALKINPKILKAIEDNEVANLPARTFLRGFVRSYAQYLRLDGNAMLKMLEGSAANSTPAPPLASEKPQEVKAGKDERKTEKEKKNEADPVSEKKPSGKRDGKNSSPLPPSSGNRVIMAIGLIALLGAIVFVFKLIEKYQNESRHPHVQIKSGSELPQDAKPDIKASESPPPIDQLAEQTPSADGNPLPTDGIPAAGSSDKLSEASPSPAPSGSPPVSATAKPSVTPQTSASPSPKPSVSPSPTTTAKPSASPSPTTTPSASPSATPEAASQAVEVIVEALNQVDIKYSFGDDKFQNITLAAEEIHTFKSKRGIQFEMSDGGSVSLIVNGRDRGVPGSIGKPIKLSYPK